MSFNSALFLVFFPIVTFVYFITPHKYRWTILLLASIYFYMCFIPAYVLILFFMIAVDYLAGLTIERVEGKMKKMILIASITTNIGILFVFKYFNFFNGIIEQVANYLHLYYPITNFTLLLPIGLSFHTFQSLSYTIEVYRGNQKAEKHPGLFALYVMFYPQLVAGPIERPQNMLHQFRDKHHFSLTRLNSGLKLMILGFLMKVVIADRLALFVNEVYSQPQSFIGRSFIVATIFFAFQIYCDFAGYSLIAIGSARTMGFELMENFKRPYISRSISEFWQRWHISLSSWFRDYVYIPLGGNRRGRFRTGLNILVTFLLSGLWHGAGWTYVVWGLINGFYITLSNNTEKFRDAWAKRFGLKKGAFFRSAWQTVVTFTAVCLGWIFFRASNLSDATYIVTHLFSGREVAQKFGNDPLFLKQIHYLNQPKFEYYLAWALIFGLLAFEWWWGRRRAQKLPITSPLIRPLAITAALLTIFLFGEFRSLTFIYFQF